MQSARFTAVRACGVFQKHASKRAKEHVWFRNRSCSYGTSHGQVGALGVVKQNQQCALLGTWNLMMITHAALVHMSPEQVYQATPLEGMNHQLHSNGAIRGQCTLLQQRATHCLCADIYAKPQLRRPGSKEPSSGQASCSVAKAGM